MLREPSCKTSQALLRAATLAAALTGILIAAPTRAEEAERVRLWLGVEQTAGAEPRGLTRADLQVVAGGVEIPADNLELLSPRQRAAGEPARIAIYFDAALAQSATLRTAAEALAGLAERLSELGEVEIVIADNAPRAELSTREVAVLKQRLATAVIQLEGQPTLLDTRAEVFAELEKLAPGGAKPGSKAATGDAAAIVERGLVRELARLQTRLDLLVTWAAERSSERPQALFWVQDGFDLDPAAFYRASLLDDVGRALAARPGFQAAAEQSARALAASGWTVVPLALRPADRTPPAVQPTAILLDDPMGQEPPPGGIGIKIRPHRVSKWWRERRGEDGPPEPALTEPIRALQLFADATGGTVATDTEMLMTAVQRLLGGYELVFPAPPGEGGERALEVRSLRPELTLHARRFWSHAIPETVTAARLRRLLAGDDLSAPLELLALLRLDDTEATLPTHAELELLLDFGEPDSGEVPDRAVLEKATLAITLAATTTGAATPSVRYVLAPQDLRAWRSWHHRLTAELPAGASDLAVSVELVGTDLWSADRVEGVVIEPERRGENLLEPLELPAHR